MFVFFVMDVRAASAAEAALKFFRCFSVPARLFLLPRCMECRRSLVMRILSVCLSVSPSVTRVDCDKTVERSVQI